MDLNVDEKESGPISQYLSRIPEAIKKANHFKCPSCDHHGPDQIYPMIEETVSSLPFLLFLCYNILL